MTVPLITKPGVYRRIDSILVKVRKHDILDLWVGDDDFHRYPDGRFVGHAGTDWNLVAYVGPLPEEPEPEPPQPQPDAADEHCQTQLDELSAELVAARDVCDGLNERLAELQVDRDKWHSRAVLAEGRVATLGQELTRVREEARQSLEALNDMQAQLAVATADKNTFRADASRARDQLEIARQQLQDRDAADQVPGNEQLRQQVTQLIAEREGLTQQLQMMEKQAIGLTNTLADKQRQLDHTEQQRSILLETSQDQLGQIRMAERIVSLMADKVAQLAVERA